MKHISTLFFFLLTSFVYGQDGIMSVWTNTIGGTGIDNINGVVVDSLGNVYSTGYFSGNVDFDPGIETNLMYGVAGTDIFIQKNDLNGNLIWVRRIVGTENNSGRKIALDAEGNLLICAVFSGSILIEAQYNTVINTNSSNSLAVFKFNSSGEFIWAYTTGGGGIVNPASIAIDQLGDIAIVGSFRNSVSFGLVNGISNIINSESSLEEDGFIVKINSDGECLWADGIGGTHTDRNYGVDIDSQNNIYVCGTFSYTAHFGINDDSTLYSPGSFDTYVIKYSPSGDFDWVRANEGGITSLASDIAIDENDDLYLTGFFMGTADFDPGIGVYNMTATGGGSSFIQKLTNDGAFLWSESMGGSNSAQVYGNSICSDAEGYVYSYGKFTETIDFDPSVAVYNLTSNGLEDIYAQKLDGDGNFVWARSFGGSQSDKQGIIYVDQQYNVFLSGAYYDSCSFNINSTAFTDESNGLSDGFLMKIEQDSCASFTTFVDSISMNSCGQDAYIALSAINGLEPYSFEWSVNSLDTSAINLNIGGIISVTVIGSNLCSKTSSYLFNEPPYSSDFELDANLISYEFRTGFSTDLTIDAFNYGCIETNGQLILIIDSLTSFQSAIINPDEIIGDSLIWNFENMSYESDHLIRHLILETSLLAEIGDTICLDLIINPISGDIDSTNNYKNYCYEVVNGYDPNNKQVYPQGICDANYVQKEEDLTYTIQFQNVGNSEAINIHIIDSLSPYLDINSITILGNSHTMYTEIHDGNVLDFKFDNIHLIDSASGGALSQGYVIFKVRPINSIDNGNVVFNKSEIYFDYNLPVVTNTVFNTLVNVLLTCDINMGVDEDLKSINDVKVYPNPSNGSFTIEFPNLKDVNIKVYNLSGQDVFNVEGINVSKYLIDISGPKGIYILEVLSEGEKQYYKIVKD